MHLYNERMCLMCWEMDRITVPAVWVMNFHSKEHGTYRENYCQKCANECIDWLPIAQEDDPDYKFLGKDPYENPFVPVFVRGDRVDIIRISRPPQSGTVVHCYMSNRTFTVMANVVVDGKKWPTVFPAHILSKRVPREIGKVA
jgi:hypothetical protein